MPEAPGWVVWIGRGLLVATWLWAIQVARRHSKKWLWAVGWPPPIINVTFPALFLFARRRALRPMAGPLVLWFLSMAIGLGIEFEILATPSRARITAGVLRPPVWSTDRNRGASTPNLCLAMSGGGIRSAAFNIGVLQALHETGWLNKVDVISAVSGGTYALSWLLLQPYYAGDDSTEHILDRMFDNEGLFQKRLESEAALFSGVDLSVLATLQPTLGNLLRAMLWTAPSARLANSSFTRREYREALQYEFHGLPDPDRHGRFGIRNRHRPTTEDVSLHLDLTVVKPVDFADLARFAAERNLPAFIFNTTLRVDAEHPSLSDSVFTLTSIGLGAQSYGYSRWDELPREDLEFRTIRTANVAPAISGAALSGTLQPGSSRLRKVVEMGAFDLGYFIPDFKNDAQRWIYLSDGGHSENLGVYSLLRERCQTILAVDAEYEPCFNNEAGAPCVADGRVTRYFFDSLKQLKENLRPEGVSLEISAASPAQFDPSQPVLRGTVAYAGEVEPRKADLVYVKLALGDHTVYPMAVASYARDDRRFPHHPTSDQIYSPERFRAYRELGHYAMTAAMPILAGVP